MGRRFPAVLLIVCLAGFVAGLWHLLTLRFEAGDVYPAYSSLRADPLGTMALYESLGRLPGIAVERDYSTHGRLPDGSGCAYLHLAAEGRDWSFQSEEVVKEVESFVARGGRLVIAFLPVTGQLRERVASEDKGGRKEQKPAKKDNPNRKSSKKEKKDGSPKREPGSRDLVDFISRVNVKDRWHFALGLIPLNTPEGQSPQPARVVNRSGLPLPETLVWHSGLILTNLGSGWEPIYTRGKHPVLAERKFGEGSMVIATDCFFLSNEALRNSRQSELLSWFMGNASHVVFDEAHLGITEGTGVTGLIRRYHLEWVALVLGLLAVLFLWKNAVSFVPIPDVKEDGNQIAGKEVASGFVSLLRRNIAKNEIVSACFQEWRKSALLHKSSHLAVRVKQAETLLEKSKNVPALARDPVALYLALSHILYPQKENPL